MITNDKNRIMENLNSTVLTELQTMINPFFRELDKQFATFGGDPEKFKEAVNHVLGAVSESAKTLNEAVADIVKLRNGYEQLLKTLQEKALLETNPRRKEKINTEIKEVQGKVFNLLNFGNTGYGVFNSLIPDSLRDVVKLKYLLEEQKN